MIVELNRATKSDAAEIQRLYKQLVDDSKINVTEESLNLISNDKTNFLFVGKITDKVVATAFVVICLDVMYSNQPFALVENIVVDSEYRKYGIGSQLMKFIKDFCKSNLCTKIMLLSSSNRTTAHSFFEKNGYCSDKKKGFVNYINK